MTTASIKNTHQPVAVNAEKIACENGKLHILATPIGNYADISIRALEVLKTVNLIIVEDTRHSGRLLKHFAIKNKMQALHDHNEAIFAPKIIELLQQGQNVALISDAGTPLISDPGYKLVSLAQQHNIHVVPVPGPSAVITALSVSGLATDKFCFEGFLSAKQQTRKNQLACYLNESRTMVFYEAPHRILATLKDMNDVFGCHHQAVIARELTKTFETIKKDNLQSLVQWVEMDKDQQKGEIVILVEGFKLAQKNKIDNILAPQTENILSSLLNELSLKQAVQLTVSITGDKKKGIYQRALEIRNA
ncbi:MAG: 16S rRNA (cytidine(1402)-2'-O)-methyltransferase [Pseudomonadota bacterium]